MNHAETLKVDTSQAQNKMETCQPNHDGRQCSKYIVIFFLLHPAIIGVLEISLLILHIDEKAQD